MSKKELALAGTVLGTLAADQLIGGIGISMLGGAIGIPAAAVIGLGGLAAVATMGNDSDKGTSLPDNWKDSTSLSRFTLFNGTRAYRFTVSSKGWGSSYYTYGLDSTYRFGEKFFSNLEDMRELYRSLKKQGFKPA